MIRTFDIDKFKINLLKCDQCKLPFGDYCVPKFLPCFKTICTTCEHKIHREAIDKRFKCGVCKKDHYIPDDGFVLNEMAIKIIDAEPIEITNSLELDQFQLNLRKLDSLAKSIILDTDFGVNLIQEHFTEQIRLVQLSTENKIDKINNLNDKLIEAFRNYEKKCIESFLSRNESINMKKNTVLREVDCFLKDKQVYLNQNNINDEELKILNKESENMQSLLNEEKLKFKSLVFDNQLIEFKSNEDEINEYELGEIEWRRLNEYPTVFNFLYHFISLYHFVII